MDSKSANTKNPSDFLTYLEREFVRRVQSNPRYSLRAFARSLGVEPSALSKILTGKRQVSLPMFDRIVKKLELDHDEIELYQPGKIIRGRPKGKNQTRNAESTIHFKQLNIEKFRTISSWQHYAILELTRVHGFVPNNQWIAKALGLSVGDVRIAVDRMLKLGYLKIDSTGRWIDASGRVTTVGNDFTCRAFRKLQRQVLKKAIIALRMIPMEQRDQSSITMAISSAKLLEAKERIKKFRRELCHFLTAGNSESPLDEVYHLSLSLYPVTDMKTKGLST